MRILCKLIWQLYAGCSLAHRFYVILRFVRVACFKSTWITFITNLSVLVRAYWSAFEWVGVLEHTTRTNFLCSVMHFMCDRLESHTILCYWLDASRNLLLVVMCYTATLAHPYGLLRLLNPAVRYSFESIRIVYTCRPRSHVFRPSVRRDLILRYSNVIKW
jgi:hypothetical protein